ncbi:signal peptidase I [Microbacterium sp. W1N]|uniref:signal peptidase I n=1 Tax=Microbacterium festucae TaxID=2977531 RepID=UPI0021BE38ED|nr:signal peptidase I [Microbacterium festucae]MCT9819011.1 signal peptidase I [Microbacterium festucae]
MKRRLAAAAAVVTAAAVVGVAAAQPTVLRAQSASMAPAVQTGDLLLGGGRPQTPPARGDIVVFSDPGGWAQTAARLTGAADVPDVFVKRVIGLPGERVACCDGAGRLTVDGEPLVEPYLAPDTTLASVLAFSHVVPTDAVFVLGDNRTASVDSRYLGSVPLEHVVTVAPWVVPLH